MHANIIKNNVLIETLTFKYNNIVLSSSLTITISIINFNYYYYLFLCLKND